MADRRRGVYRTGGRIARALTRRWARRFTLEAPAWQALEAELDRWPSGKAVFWWRDDDAVAPTAALERLLGLRAGLNLPLAIAVVPAAAEPSLAAALRPVAPADIRVLTHGWDHRNLAGPGRPKAELAAGRSSAEVLTQLGAGRTRLAELFGDRALPVLVPPFNQLASHLVPSVRRAGFRHVSIEGDFTGLGFPNRNVHADVVDWRLGTGATSIELTRGMLAALRLRRFGLIDRATPVGVLTHHLVHDEAAWTVSHALLARLAAHRAVSFPPISEIFAP